jgi:hypothetical protein
VINSPQLSRFLATFGRRRSVFCSRRKVPATTRRQVEIFVSIFRVKYKPRKRRQEEGDSVSLLLSLAPSFVYSSILEMAVISSFKTSVGFYQTTWHFLLSQILCYYSEYVSYRYNYHHDFSLNPDELWLFPTTGLHLRISSVACDRTIRH